MNRRFPSTVGVIVLLVLASVTLIAITAKSVQALGTLDQSWAPGAPGGYNYVKTHSPIGQSFTPTLDNLVGVDVYVENIVQQDQADTATTTWDWITGHSPIGQSFTPSYPLFTGFEVDVEKTAGVGSTITMNLHSGTIGGAIIGTASFFMVPGPHAFVHTDMPSPVPVTPGAVYVIELTDPSGTVRWWLDGGATYPGGTFIDTGAPSPGLDAGFKTFGVTNSLTANVHSGSIGGPIVGTSTLSISVESPTWQHIDFTQFGITPGSTYVLELSVPQDSLVWHITIPGGTYPGGNAITNGNPQAGADYYFKTYGIPAAFNFSLILTTSGAVAVTQGNSASWGVNVNLVSGSTQPVTLTVVGALPLGVGTNTPITNSPTFSSTIIITTSGSTPVGIYPFVISASGGGVTQAVPITLTVNSAGPSPDFSIGSSSSITVVQGTSGSSAITITSMNGFSSSVDLGGSWFGSAPSSGVTFSLPTPVTPPSGSTATSTLTVSASGGASTGSFTLRVTGTSGSLTHFVDVTVQINAATTSTTTSTPTTATVTVTTSTTSTPAAPSCLIATATYGSELAPEVQLLRNFRDNSIMRTQSGSSFMIAFNAWYYSFSPYVANYLTSHWVERTIMKGVLYPLIGMLYLTSNLYAATATYPELATLLSGLLASSLIGAFYLGLPLSLLRAKVRRLRGSRVQSLLKKLLGAGLLAGVVVLVLGEIFASPILLMTASALVVLSSLLLSATLTSAKIAKRLQTRI